VEIVDIYKDLLYSISFDEEDLTEYHKVFREWHDVDYLVKFFTDHKDEVNTAFWKEAGLNPDDLDKSVNRVINEAESLETYIRQLVDNCTKGLKPDFDAYFHLLGGKYKCLWSLEPVKSYGTRRPSLLRLYAIRLGTNCYLVVYGGIKLGETIQNSPVLKDQVFHKIDSVLSFLKANGITGSEDI
jgi:hypothetical protein